MANNTKIVKKANSFLVMDAIRKQKCITIEGIIDNTGLSRPTVLSILKKLLEDGLVSTSGLAPSEGGRQPVLYALNANSFYAIGIDVDGPPINLVISDLNGEVVHSCSWQVNLSDEADYITSTIIQKIDEGIKFLGIDYNKVLGIGLGLPAAIDIAANETVRLSRLIKWDNFPISDTISHQTGIKVYLRNDAHLIGVAEHGLLADTDNSLFIIHRSGIGMSAVINNQVYEGAMGNAGYIGHTTLVMNGRQCDCGLKGCFEAYCSKRAIVDMYREVSSVSLKYSEILQKARDGDKNAISVLETAGEFFGIGISNFIKTYEIYTVILGDLICDEKDVFFRSILKSAKKYLSNYTNKPPRIIKGQLSEKDFGLGGCHFVLSKFFARPKLRFNS
jgi:predicted NBD/HSP70 family sugar kinase